MKHCCCYSRVPHPYCFECGSSTLSGAALTQQLWLVVGYYHVNSSRVAAQDVLSFAPSSPYGIWDCHQHSNRRATALIRTGLQPTFSTVRYAAHLVTADSAVPLLRDLAQIHPAAVSAPRYGALFPRVSDF